MYWLKNFNAQDLNVFTNKESEDHFNNRLIQFVTDQDVEVIEKVLLQDLTPII